jgi:5'-nucleotidase
MVKNMARPKFLVTNDDGWDAPGLAALKSFAARLGDVYVVAPRDPHSYAGHRVTTDAALTLTPTAANEYHLTGTPADCVRVALTALFPQIDWVLSGINRGGNLGVDIYSSGTVAAAREAAFLGKPAVAISQYVRRGLPLDWEVSTVLAGTALARILTEEIHSKEYWNVNLPHLDGDPGFSICECRPDDEPLDVRFKRDGDAFHYSGAYIARPATPGRDVEKCFQGAVTVSRLRV